jgi:outer membrane protein OmpA-like peptidoglycan-associated protein
MRLALLAIPMLLVLGSCGSPPKPPGVDESTKRPANARTAVELQICKGDLSNTQILASESSRTAEISLANLQRLVARLRRPDTGSASVASPQPGNSIFTIRFAFASTRVIVPADIGTAMVESTRAAPLVLIRGRTDGDTDTAAEGHIARGRAAAVREYLVAAGVDPNRIRVSWQPAGDHAVDNSSAAGRSINRRVEIEVYRALPVAMSGGALAQR